MSDELMSLLMFLAQQSSSGSSGSGGSSIYITNCTISDEGDLIVSLSDGSTLNAGKCKGENGVSPEITSNVIENGVEILINGIVIATIKDGDKGDKGDNGESPLISVYSNTPGSYQLKITNADGSSFITPNLIGVGSTTTRYYVFENALYTQYLDNIFTLFGGQLKSIQDYINSGSGFCNEESNYTLYYNTNDFGWAGSVISFSVVPMTLSNTQMLLFGYSANSLKSGEYFKFIPANLVTGSTYLEKAQSIKTLLESGSSEILSIDFEYVYAINGVTEAVSLDSIPNGEYYIVWTATSDNSMPKISDITIM